MSPRAERIASRRWADRSGFTLIEAMVAFTVMATVLGVLYRNVVQTRAGSVAFGQRTQVEVVARSLLAEFRARRELRDGSYAGNRDGRRWTLKASAMDLEAQLPEGEKAMDKPDPAAPAKPVWVAQRLVLRVATGSRPLETEAVHLVRQPPPDDGAPR